MVNHKSYIYIICIALLSCLAACKGKQPQQAKAPAKVVTVEKIPDFVETRGIIGDGSSMNLLQLIEFDGDTLDIIAANQMIMGGLIVGNEVDVIYSLIDGNLVAQTAVNLTVLQHLWSQHVGGGETKSLEIDSNGRATTYNMSIEYDHWAVHDGVLLLSSPRKVGDEKPADVDTFQIMMLTEDSLVLMANTANMASAFYRDN